ncbi:MAG: RIO1 family regulatory kinase/ATPase domain-containing protein [Candidatus Hodarchaeales archaeon]
MPLSITQSFLNLTQIDFRILSVIEILMAKYEFVPVEEIARFMKYNEKKVENYLKHLKKLKLVFIVQKHYLGSALTFIGYDALALKALVEKGILSQIGPEIGAGKESNVHLGMNDDGKELIVKFHRLGKLDFRATRKSRSFVAEKRHLSPLYESRLSAEREYKALSHLHGAREIINGQDLYRKKRKDFGSEEEISLLFHKIIAEIKKCVDQGYIHGDLSEYNIRLDENDHPVLFDWPQYIEGEEEQAEDILTRDYQNIINFFQKKFQVTIHYEFSEILTLLDK